MPWLIQSGGPAPWGEDQQKHIPTPKYTEWEKRWEVWAEARRADKKVDAQDVFVEELYQADPIQNRDHMPRTILWSKRGQLKDCVAFFHHLVVSGRVRDLIAELEPGVHEFIEITMENQKTGEVSLESFWLLHVRNNVDSLDEERTDDQRSQFVFRAGAIEGVHLWRDARRYMRRDIFASDQFVKELELRGIEGIGAETYCETVGGGIAG